MGAARRAPVATGLRTASAISSPSVRWKAGRHRRSTLGSTRALGAQKISVVGGVVLAAVTLVGLCTEAFATSDSVSTVRTVATSLPRKRNLRVPAQTRRRLLKKRESNLKSLRPRDVG